MQSKFDSNLILRIGVQLVLYSTSFYVTCLLFLMFEPGYSALAMILHNVGEIDFTLLYSDNPNAGVTGVAKQGLQFFPELHRSVEIHFFRRD